MQELFDNLMKLIDPANNVGFYLRDNVTNGGTPVRIFGYHYASYNDWLKPDALESRGIMFEMDGDKPVRIMSRPMEKFFNLDENPFTMNLDLAEIEYGMDKADGSLVSTYTDCDDIFFKSKGSIHSEQAVQATNMLWGIRYLPLRAKLLQLAKEGYTCNFEYVAPTNRVVIAYQQPDLILLNVRHNETGEYVSYRDLVADAVLREFLVPAMIPDFTDQDQFVEQIRALEDVEGYVFRMNDGQAFKLKTAWYSNLHRVKDTLGNNEALFQVVVSGGSDDIKSLFDDAWSRTKIETFETIFFDYLRGAINDLTEFHNTHRGIERKDYAVQSQTKFRELEKFELFGISMLLYSGQIDVEGIVDEVNKVFMKNFARFVPEEYKVITAGE